MTTTAMQQNKEKYEELNTKHQPAGVNDEGETEYFFSPKKSAGERLSEELEKMGKVRDEFYKEADKFLNKLI